jgi:Tol biopolymer transport system component
VTDLRDQLQQTLGDGYTIERELGGGGMSRVFVATENTLGRQIVVKVVPSDAASSVSIERFNREIQVAAKLQHPHIVPVLSAGTADGVPFYTMPFVKGESLRARLTKSGELSVNEAMHIMRDIASALAHAHAEGIVHRDIKPENVILSGGVAVVTDFGVAKAMDLAVTQGGGLASGLTSLGVALGTPAYMAPEQAMADPHVDHRADIYAFGCVAYEMLTGAAPFAGRPLQQLLAAHVTEVPDSLLMRRTTAPPALAALVMKCLEKRAGDRPQSASELIASLDAIATPSGGSMPTSARLAPFRQARSKWIIAGASAIAIGAVAFAAWSRTNRVRPLTVGQTTRIAFAPELEVEPAISPDGKLIAYGAQTPSGMKVFVRQIDGGRANAISGDLQITGGQPWPSWSPDGSRVSFRAASAIYVVPALGGEPKRTIDADRQFNFTGLVEGAGTHAWSPDGKEFVYAIDDQIWIRAVDGGEPRSVAKGATPHSPAWSPNRRFIAYADGPRPQMFNTSTNTVWVVDVRGGTPIRISDSTHINVSPVWAPDGGSVLFISDAGGARDVFQQAVGSDGRPRGAPARVTTGLGPFRITLSADGSRMAYDVVRNFANIWVVPIGKGTVATTAAATPVTRENQRVESMDVSHDGKWIVYDSDRGGNFDIYKLRLDGGDPVQLTTNPANDFAPSWSPNDHDIAFHSTRAASRDIFVVGADGGAEHQVTSSQRHEWYPRWWPDGQGIVFASDSSGSARMDVAKRARDGAWSVQPLAIDTALSPGARNTFPNGQFVAYSRRGALAIVPIGGGAPRILATTAQLGGASGVLGWSRDGQTVFTLLDVIWAVPVSGGVPRVALTIDPTHPFARPDYATDGTRVFFTKPSYESDVWVMELKR